MTGVERLPESTVLTSWHLIRRKAGAYSPPRPARGLSGCSSAAKMVNDRVAAALAGSSTERGSETWTGAATSLRDLICEGATGLKLRSELVIGSVTFTKSLATWACRLAILAG